MPGLGQPAASLPTVPSGPLPVTALSTTSWRTRYPRIGQFAMTERDEIIAAVPSGLFHFKQVNDHASKPWSEGRLLPNTTMLNDSSVSGLAAIMIETSDPRLYVYCVSGGTLHTFHRSMKDGSSWAKDSQDPFPYYPICGTPAIAHTIWDSKRWNLVVPCQSGGLLHTSTDGSSFPGCGGSYYGGMKTWESVTHVAEDLGIISSASIAAIKRPSEFGYGSTQKIDLVMVCIASGRLHTAEGEVLQRLSSGYSRSSKWDAQAPTRILHPGEVTGNPTLIQNVRTNQLDLLVPSAEGGIFHFVRTASSPDEWHMIARIAFPQGLPAASCLAINSEDLRYTNSRQFRALIQSGGQWPVVPYYNNRKF
ncbi:hypothetical protein F4808DRAFT_405540 [Astrocystis sublimbata]|nr:hypothetical protein F4808DRAFT_405540 [Astrocystis sublimbata]